MRRRAMGLRRLAGNPRVWMWGSVVVGALLVALIASLVLRQPEAMEVATRRVESVQQARTDLARGILYVRTAGDPAAPRDPAEGAALVRQALAAFDHAVVALEAPEDGATVAFRQSAGALTDRLAEWQAATQPDAGLTVRLQAAYDDVEREAARLEALARRLRLELEARLGAELAIVLAAAALMLVAGGAVSFGIERVSARSRAALVESQEQLRFALEGSNDGLWDLQLPSGSVYLSPRACEILGYLPGELPRVEAAWEQLVHPDDLPASLVALDAYLAGRVPIFEVEQRLRTASGELTSVLTRGKAVERDAQGAPTRMVGTYTDISARKQAEESLRVSEERLRLAVDAADLGLYDLNVQTGESSVNEQYARMLGYDPAGFHLDTAAWIEQLHPDERDAVAARYRDFVAGKRPDYRVDFRQRTRSGGWKWIMSLAQVVERDAQGAPLRIVGVHTDISERKLAEEQLRAAAAEAADMLDKEVRSRRALLSIVEDQKATERVLRESESLYRSLFENMLNGFAYCRMLFEHGRPEDFVYLAVNEAFETLTGLKGVVGRRVTEVIPGIRESDPLLFEIYGRVALTGTPEKFETFVEAMRMWFSISVYRPEPECFVAVFDVITERKQAEAAIHQLNEELEQRVVERTARLATANQELESFSYSVSHDLRAPLRAISGFASSLARRHRDSLDEKGRHYVDTIVSASDHMGVLIEELLDYSRMGRRTVRAEAVPLGPIATQLRVTFGDRITESGATLEVIEPLATPEGDRTLLERILVNLVDNALTYHRPDVAARVTLSAARRGRKVSIAIADNGIGVPAEYRERIFEVFARLHGDDEYPGTGIGLSIVRKAARLMGSDVTVESTEGVGSIFRLELPAASERRAKA